MSLQRVYLVSLVLGAFMVLGAQNVFVNARAAYRRRLWVNGAQAAASVFQLLNQLSFVALFTQSASGFFGGACRLFQDAADGCYLCFQALASGVLIWRTTGLLTGQRRTGARLASAAVLCIALGLLAHSIIVKQSFVREDRCEAAYDRVTNTAERSRCFASTPSSWSCSCVQPAPI